MGPGGGSPDVARWLAVNGGGMAVAISCKRSDEQGWGEGAAQWE